MDNADCMRKDVSCSPMLTPSQMSFGDLRSYVRPRKSKRVSAIPFKFFNLEKLGSFNTKSKCIKLLVRHKSKEKITHHSINNCSAHQSQRKSYKNKILISRNDRLTNTVILKNKKRWTRNHSDIKDIKYKPYSNIPQVDLRTLFNHSIENNSIQNEPHPMNNHTIHNLLVKRRNACKIQKSNTIDMSDRSQNSCLPALKSNYDRYKSIVPSIEHECKLPIKKYDSAVPLFRTKLPLIHLKQQLAINKHDTISCKLNAYKISNVSMHD